MIRNVTPADAKAITDIYNQYILNTTISFETEPLTGQWKFSGDKHKSLQVDTERTFHQRYLLVML